MKPPITLPDTDDPYVLLDVRPGASADQIRRAYLRKVKMWKPDRHPAEFRRIREAYDRLREQERWFDAWQKAGAVVHRAAEDPANSPGDEAAPQPEAGSRAEDAPAERALQGDALEALDDEPVEDEDVDALIAALELELREHPHAGDDDDRYDADEDDQDDERGPYLLDEHRRRRARATASGERLERLETLAQAVHADLEAGRLAEAADRLLEPGTEAMAVHPEFASLLLEVCCAVVWELPPRYAALVARYGDLVSNHDTEHHDGALLHRRILLDELPAWRKEVAADWPELHRFMVLGSSLRAPAEAELGLRLGRRAIADPTGLLLVLARAAERAPGIVTLYVTMAERWARCYGRLPLPLPRPTRPRPTVEQAAAAMAHAAQHHRRVRWEQARPLLVTLATMLVLLLAPTPFIELVVLGVVILLWAWRAWARGPVARIYAQVVRPTAAAWLWATSATPSELAAALQAKLPAPGTWGAVLHPGELGEYPERLRDDLALLAFGITSPMIPRLRTPGSAGSSTR